MVWYCRSLQFLMPPLTFCLLSIYMYFFESQICLEIFPYSGYTHTHTLAAFSAKSILYLVLLSLPGSPLFQSQLIGHLREVFSNLQNLTMQLRHCFIASGQ